MESMDFFRAATLLRRVHALVSRCPTEAFRRWRKRVVRFVF
jgi:predicted secreted protein